MTASTVPPVSEEIGEAVSEGYAALMAASAIFNWLGGCTDTPLGTHFLQKACDLKVAVMGPTEGEDDPLEVYLEISDAEATADALELMGVPSRAALYREHARRMREADSVKVPSPFTEALRAAQAA